MGWAQSPKVASIQGCQLWLPKPLHYGQYSRIYKTDIGVCVSITNLSDTFVISLNKLCDLIGPIQDVVQQGHKNAGMEPCVNPVVYLDHDRRGNDERLGGFLNELATGFMVCIPSVQ